MKKISIAALLVLAITTSAFATTVTMTWTYPTESVEELAGFKSYHEGVFLCDSADLVNLTMTCPLTPNHGHNGFTLTAFLIDGTESAHSAEITDFYFSPPGNPIAKINK